MVEDIFNWLRENNHKLPYVLTGKVVQNFSPLHPASVKVKISERDILMNTTCWAKVLMPFAGAGNGMYSLPDIGDEVAVMFISGEIDMPIVIGALYTLTSLPPPEALNPLNTVKLTKTKLGNKIKLDDTPGMSGVEIQSTAKLAVKMEDTTLSVTIKDAAGTSSIKIDGTMGKITVQGLTGVDVKAGACSVSLDGAGQSVTVKAPTVNVKADAILNLEGTQLNIKGTAVTVQANAQLDLKSSGILNVNGTMVKIN